MALPAWLEAHLTDIGAHNPDRVSTGARMAGCRDCARPVLLGLDGDRAALVATATPDELDAAGELVALAIGLRTYALIRTATSSGRAVWNLNPRTQWAIAAGLPDGPLVAQHRCGVAVPPARTSRILARHAPRPRRGKPDF